MLHVEIVGIFVLGGPLQYCLACCRMVSKDLKGDSGPGQGKGPKGKSNKNRKEKAAKGTVSKKKSKGEPSKKKGRSRPAPTHDGDVAPPAKRSSRKKPRSDWAPK